LSDVGVETRLPHVLEDDRHGRWPEDRPSTAHVMDSVREANLVPREPRTIDPEPHPVAAIFPAMTESELSVLADDIAAYGLLQPIVLDREGRLLDGRNRLAACKRAGCQPRFATYAGDDPLGYCVSINIKRRQLSPSQLACLAVELEPFYAEQAKQRQRRSGGDRRSDHRPLPPPVAEPTELGESIGHAATAIGVGRSTARAAKRIKTQLPEMYKQIQTGAKTVKAAERELKQQSLEPTEQAAEEVLAFAAIGDAASQLATSASKVMRVLNQVAAVTAQLDPGVCARILAPSVPSTSFAEVDRILGWLAAFRTGLQGPGHETRCVERGSSLVRLQKARLH
jgi:hypothetical protein